MVAMGRWFRVVAAIDEDNIRLCPTYDRIWATHIGASLTFTLLIVTTISYFSLSYIGGTAIEFDGATAGPSLVSRPRTAVETALFVLIALTIGIIVFMFDRAIYQSDWFFQTPLDSNSVFRRIVFVVRKLMRIATRMALSLCVAYALSIFLELRIFESYIVNAMQRSHLADNAAPYERIARESQKIEEDIENQRNHIRELETNLQDLSKPEEINVSDKIRSIESALDAVDTGLKGALAQIDTDEVARLAPHVESARQADIQTDAISARIAEYTRLVNAERYGNPENLDGVSGLPGCENRCRYYESLLAGQQQLKKEALERRSTLTARMAEIREQATERRRVAVEKARAATVRLEEERASVTRAGADLSAARRREREDEANRANAVLAAARTHLAGLEATARERIGALRREVTQSPEFVPYRDGPLDRLRALHELRADKNFGPVAHDFSLWVMFFIIFLEVIPVITKMFFSPPSVYAMLLQAEAARGIAQSRRIVGDSGVDTDMALEEKRIELQKKRQSRLMQERTTRDLDESLNQERTGDGT